MQIVAAILLALQATCYSMDWKVKKLEAAISGSHLDLDSKLFESLVEGDRNYTIIVLLTTIYSEHKCGACPGIPL
jgi:hypothetical protein